MLSHKHVRSARRGETWLSGNVQRWLDQKCRLRQPRKAQEDGALYAGHPQLFRRQKVARGEDISSQLIEFDVGVRGSKGHGAVTIASGLQIFH
jgi:hypothetical protein